MWAYFQILAVAAALPHNYDVAATFLDAKAKGFSGVHHDKSFHSGVMADHGKGAVVQPYAAPAYVAPAGAPVYVAPAPVYPPIEAPAPPYAHVPAHKGGLVKGKGPGLLAGLFAGKGHHHQKAVHSVPVYSQGPAYASSAPSSYAASALPAPVISAGQAPAPFAPVPERPVY